MENLHWISIGDLNLRNKWRVKICPIWVLYCLNFTIKPDPKTVFEPSAGTAWNLQMWPTGRQCMQKGPNYRVQIPISETTSILQKPCPYFRDHIPISGTKSLFCGPCPDFRDQDPISETRSLFQGKGLHCKNQVLILKNQVNTLGGRSLSGIQVLI